MIPDSSTLVASYFSPFPLKKYSASEILFHAGEAPIGVNYLESGIVRQFSTSAEGTEHTLNLYKPGTFFPLSFALNGTPNRYAFQAVTTSEVRVAPAGELVSFLKSQPSVMYELLQRVFKGLDGMLLKMEQQTTGDAYTKLVVSLLILARRFGEVTSEGTAINLQLRHHDLTTHSGLTRETVSRLLHTLRDKEILTHQDQNLVILNLTQLEAELPL